MRLKASRGGLQDGGEAHGSGGAVGVEREQTEDVKGWSGRLVGGAWAGGPAILPF